MQEQIQNQELDEWTRKRNEAWEEALQEKRRSYLREAYSRLRYLEGKPTARFHKVPPTNDAMVQYLKNAGCWEGVSAAWGIGFENGRLTDVPRKKATPNEYIEHLYRQWAANHPPTNGKTAS